MLNIENMNNINEIKSFFNQSENAANIILNLCKKFFIPKLSSQLDSIKKRGYSGSSLIMFLIYLPFLGVSTVAGLFKSGHANLSKSQKDAYYRLKNNPLINWRKILFGFSKQFKKLTIENGEPDTQSVKCFIADDTDAPKTGRKIEFIGKIFSHVVNTWILGFKVLALGYWDGKSFIPLDFSLHAEKGKNKKRPFGLLISELKKRFSKKRSSNSFGFKRAAELSNNKIKNVVKMVKRSVKYGFMADYLLVDSWFASEFLIKSIRKIKQGAIHVLGMCKMDKRKYLYYGEEYTAKQLLQKLKGRKKRSRKINAWYIELTVDYKGIPLKLFFSRYSKRGKWHLLFSTNLQLSFNQAIEIYNIRWSIEVFFKESKQYLQLGKSQSNDFDAQLADITIAMIQYIMLACHKRFTAYETIGELFRRSRENLLELSIANRLWLLFLNLQNKLLEILEIDINEALEKFFHQVDYEALLLKLLKSLANPDSDSKLQQLIIQYN
jgi:hypothetical protein